MGRECLSFDAGNLTVSVRCQREGEVYSTTGPHPGGQGKTLAVKACVEALASEEGTSNSSKTRGKDKNEVSGTGERRK